MSYTLNNLISLFQEIVTKHYQLQSFGFGNMFDINGQLKQFNYPVLWMVPLESVTTENTKQRKFLLVVADLVQEDQSNRDHVWSDCEQMLDDVIKILRYESDDYEIVGDPSLLPVTEQHGDWITGWQAEITIQSQFNNNYCDIPMDALSDREAPRQYARILDQNGNVVSQLHPGQDYTVIIASGIDEGGASQTYTIQVVDI